MAEQPDKKLTDAELEHYRKLIDAKASLESAIEPGTSNNVVRTWVLDSRPVALTVSQKIIRKLQQDVRTLEWSGKQWAEFCSCTEAAVYKSEAWDWIRKRRAQEKADRT